MIRKLINKAAMLGALGITASWIYWYIESIPYGWRVPLAFNDYGEGPFELLMFIIIFCLIATSLLIGDDKRVVGQRN